MPPDDPVMSAFLFIRLYADVFLYNSEARIIRGWIIANLLTIILFCDKNVRRCRMIDWWYLHTHNYGSIRLRGGGGGYLWTLGKPKQTWGRNMEKYHDKKPFYHSTIYSNIGIRLQNPAASAQFWRWWYFQNHLIKI